MKRWRNALTLLLAVCLMAGMLAGCTESADTGSQSSQAELSESQPSEESSASTDEDPLSAEAQTQLEYEALFEKDNILNINVELPEESWAGMLANPTAEEYYSATVTVGDITLENVGFRTKGNSTLRSVSQSDSDRYSFRIKFDKYEDGQSLLGLDEMVVNNHYSDPSYLREYLSYEAFRSIGAQVPLTVFVNLSINGELYGFYLGVEAIDDSLLERFYGNNDGNLYKAEQRSALVYEENSSYETLELKNGDDEAKEGLQRFISLLNEMPEGEKGEIESILDVDSALQYIAAQTVLGNYDSYSGEMCHNYYLCQNEGIFSVIPWDYNMSFGGFGGRGGGGGGGSAATTIPIDEPVYGVPMESRPLISKLLAVPEYLERYHGYVEALCDYLDGFQLRVEELAELIRPYVEADPTKFYTMEQFESALVYTESADLPDNSQEAEPPSTPTADEARPEGGYRQRPEGGFGGGPMMSGGSILTFALDRLENVRAQLAGDLPTTGNTTMEQGSGFGFGGGRGGPPAGFGGEENRGAPPEGFEGRGAPDGEPPPMPQERPDDQLPPA